jgi:hypothetical protein
MQHFEKFCVEELGFKVQEIGNFAVHFGWEAAWVGPMHVVATATKNTWSQWLSILYALGLKEKFEEYMCGFKIDVRTIMRSVKGGEKLIAAALWADAGDFIDAVTKGRVFPIKHPDTMNADELREAYDRYLSNVAEEERTHAKLMQAVAEKDGVPSDLFEILLKCEHLWSELCKTVWSKRESWESYVERVRNYDPVSVTFKKLHYALVFGHGLDYGELMHGNGDNETGMRMTCVFMCMVYNFMFMHVHDRSGCCEHFCLVCHVHLCLCLVRHVHL